MKTTLDFGEPPDPEGDPPDYVEEGWYGCVILSVEKKQAQGQGSDYLKFELLPVLPFVHPGFRFYLILSCNPKAVWRAKEFLIAMGIPEHLLVHVVEFDSEAYVGRGIRVKVSIDQYADKLHNSIRKVERWES